MSLSEAMHYLNFNFNFSHSVKFIQNVIEATTLNTIFQHLDIILIIRRIKLLIRIN